MKIRSYRVKCTVKQHIVGIVVVSPQAYNLLIALIKQKQSQMSLREHLLSITVFKNSSIYI